MKILSSIATFESALVVLRSLEIGFVYIFSFIIYMIVVSLVLFTDKKLIFFFTDITAFFYLVFSFILSHFYYFSLTLFTPLLGYVLLPKHSEVRSSIYIFLINLISTILYINILIVLYSFIISFIFYYYIHIINKKGEKITGLKSLQILRPFIINVTKKDSKSLEKFLEDISMKTVVHIGVFKIGNIYFVIPKIHYGISGDIGSSKFIYQLENENSLNIAFHGPGSHEIDIASSSQSAKIAKLVAEEEMKNDGWTKLSFYGISEWNCGQFFGITLNFGEKSLSFIQRPNYGIDDLPIKLWDFTIKSGNYIVDCHNEYLSQELPFNTFSCITNGILKSLSNKKEKPLIIGYEDDRIENCEGLCNNKIRVTYISDGEKDAAIIYIYSNNADPLLTNKIREKLRNVVDYPILVTPDDHSCTGTVVGDLYTPAQPCESLVEKAYELTLKAKKNAKKGEVSFKKIEVKGVKVLGSFISLMVNALEEVGSYAMRTFWIPLVMPFILTILFVLLANIHIKFSY